jgi:hypothetical protein
MSSRSTFYLAVDSEGRVVSHNRIPNEMFPPDIAAGTRIVVPADGKGPETDVRVDLRKVREPVNHVASIEDVLTAWRPDPMPEHVIVDMERRKRIADLDQIYSERLAEIAGPLAAIHAEKRRQAEAGGGPLVADEADRLAILANAAAQDEAVAAIERERREVKALLRAAKSRNELAAIEASLKR